MNNYLKFISTLRRFPPSHCFSSVKCKHNILLKKRGKYVENGLCYPLNIRDELLSDLFSKEDSKHSFDLFRQVIEVSIAMQKFFI